MKHLLLSLSLFISGATMAQVACPAEPCSQYVTFDSTANRNFTGNICLRGDYTIPTSIDSCTLTNYTRASLNHIRWDAALVMTGGQELFLNHCILDTLVLSGVNTVYVIDSAFVVDATIFAGAGLTTVYVKPGGFLWIGGQYHYGGSSYGSVNVVECGQILALPAVRRSPFVPSITYRFIVTPFYGGREIRKICTYKALLQWLPANQTVVIEAGGLRQVTTKK